MPRTHKCIRIHPVFCLIRALPRPSVVDSHHQSRSTNPVVKILASTGLPLVPL
jgi:hypothetical protein